MDQQDGGVGWTGYYLITITTKSSIIMKQISAIVPTHSFSISNMLDGWQNVCWLKYLLSPASVPSWSRPYGPVRAWSLRVLGYEKARRGSCRCTHTSGSSSRAAVSVHPPGSGRSPQQCWCDEAGSRRSRCTGRSSAACKRECWRSPGGPAEWGLETCSWPHTAPAGLPGRAQTHTR